MYAGAGKSKIISALLWHLFQHDASRLVVVTSYTWKAAAMIGTPHNPAYSSCSTFGINPRTNPRVNGASAIANTLLNPDVVLIIDDEISLTPQTHLHVSTSCYGLIWCHGP